MKNTTHKTNAMRLLDSAGISYETRSYEVDESNLSGVRAAQVMGVDPGGVFKTLVCRAASGGYVVFCIPVAEELDMKKAARAAGEKSVELLPLKELFGVTGYVRGGVSPLAMKKAFPTFIDETAILYDAIGVSAGERGIQVVLDVSELASVIGAQLVNLCE